MYLRDPPSGAEAKEKPSAFSIFGHKVYDDDDESVLNGIRDGVLIEDQARIQGQVEREQDGWDSKFSKDKNLWQLACGEGSAASQESAILVISYLSAIGVISVFSNNVALGLGIVFAFIPYYHWTVTARSKAGVVRRAGTVLVDHGYEFTRIIYDNTLCQFNEMSVELAAVKGRLSTCLKNSFNKTAINSVEAFTLYKRILQCVVPEFEVVGTDNDATISRKFCGKKTVRRHIMQMTEKGNGIRLGGCKYGVVKEDRIDKTTAHGVKGSMVVSYYRHASQPSFTGTDRMEILDKVINGRKLEAIDVMTLVHDISLIRGRRYKMMGVCFDGVAFRKERLMGLMHGFDIESWAHRKSAAKAPDPVCVRDSPEWVEMEICGLENPAYISTEIDRGGLMTA